MRWLLRTVLVFGLLLGAGCSNRKSSQPSDPPIPTYPPGKGAEGGGKSGPVLSPK